MAKAGRNDLCPCGSGKKYKRCCADKDAAASSAEFQAKAEASRTRTRALLEALDEHMHSDDGLTEASNAVADLVDAGKLDEAEAGARDLLVRYPDVHDGYDRLGMVAEARGDKKLAASCYRKVAEFARLHADRYDSELADTFQRAADELDPPGEG